MTPTHGAVVLLKVPLAPPAQIKVRPALVLDLLPGPFQHILVCGISTARLSEIVDDWDEVFDPADEDFEQTGLLRRSAARLSFLYSASDAEIEGVIGMISRERLERARQHLARHLTGAQSADAT